MTTEKSEKDDDLLTPRQVAEIFQVTVYTLENWRGLLKGPKFTKLGDSPRSPVRYSRGDVNKFLKERESK